MQTGTPLLQGSDEQRLQNRLQGPRLQIYFLSRFRLPSPIPSSSRKRSVSVLSILEAFICFLAWTTQPTCLTETSSSSLQAKPPASVSRTTGPCQGRRTASSGEQACPVNLHKHPDILAAAILHQVGKRGRGSWRGSVLRSLRPLLCRGLPGGPPQARQW